MTRHPAKPLALKVRQQGCAAIVRVCGSADITQSEKMRLQLEELAAQRVPLIVLDLSDMDFICSQGLGAIVAGHLKSRHHEGQIRLVNPQPAIRDLLETTRLAKLFPIFPTIEQAVAPCWAAPMAPRAPRD